MGDSLGDRAANFFNDLKRNVEDAFNRTVDSTLSGVAADRIEARTGVNPTFLAVAVAVVLTYLIARR